jgi:hypothetical protein
MGSITARFLPSLHQTRHDHIDTVDLSSDALMQ